MGAEITDEAMLLTSPKIASSFSATSRRTLLNRFLYCSTPTALGSLLHSNLFSCMHCNAASRNAGNCVSRAIMSWTCVQCALPIVTFKGLYMLKLLIRVGVGARLVMRRYVLPFICCSTKNNPDNSRLGCVSICRLRESRHGRLEPLPHAHKDALLLVHRDHRTKREASGMKAKKAST